MGKLLIFGWYYLHIWANESHERMHIHVFRSKSKNAFGAKFWIEPKVELFEKGDFSNEELKKIEKDIQEYLPVIKSQLEKVFMGRKTKAIVITKKGKK